MNAAAVLEPVSEDWARALVVVAHPDDMEFGATAGAVARWVRQGKQVNYVLLTSGEAGIDAVDPDRARQLREREQIRACAVVGVSDVEFLGLSDGVIERGIPLRRDLVRVVRRHRPDVVVTLNFREDWGDDSELNQPDHVATGLTLLDAVSSAPNRWIFREQIEADGLEPWRGVRHVLAAGSPRATHGVDISDTFDVAVDALISHKIYNLGLRWPGFDARTWLDQIAGAVGTRMGVRHAVSFEVLVLPP